MRGRTVKFEQFRVTPISIEAAATLVGGDSALMNEIRREFNWYEFLLPTGAKLIWTGKGEFGIFSYAHDGSDGRDAYNNMRHYPVHIVCGEVHTGPVCNGKVMCQLCFEFFEIDQLNTVDGDPEDVCKVCAMEEEPTFIGELDDEEDEETTRRIEEHEWWGRGL